MILNFILPLFSSFFNFAWSFLPASDGLSENFIAGVNVFFQYSESYGFIFPFDTLYQTFLIGLGFEVSLILALGLIYILNWLRGK